MSSHVRDSYGSVCLALFSIAKTRLKKISNLFTCSPACVGMLEDKVYFFLEKACGLRERDGRDGDLVSQYTLQETNI